ncbi:MAG: LptF/LptG family permease [Ignavibacteria bacterium]|nr:LptF/LptG family permease [Ignavibacteria bacterium]
MNILDRYILRQFVTTLVFSVFALCTIFLVVNLLESLEIFLDKKIEFGTIVEYYLHFFPEILKLLMPIAALMASLFSIGRLSTANEITAMKSGGMSLYRLLMPLVVFSILLSCGQLYFNGWIVPISNAKKARIDRQSLQRGSENTMIYNLYFRDEPLRNVMMQYYDGIKKNGTNVTVEEYSSEQSPRLIHRTEASRIEWDSSTSGWKAFDVIQRDYTANEILYHKHATKPMKINLTHSQIMELQRSPNEMNLDELRSYIDLLAKGGKDVRAQMIDYYGQYAFPFANVIVVLFGVSFASVRKKSGMAVNIAAAMVICFSYLAFTKIGQSLGSAFDVDAAIIGWMPNGVFFVVAIANILRTPK